MKLAKISAAMLTITFLALGTTTSSFANPPPKNTQQQTKNSGKKPDPIPTLSPKYSQQEIETATDKLMETFSNQKLYATIFKYNPNVKQTVRKEVRNIIATSPNFESAFYRGQALGSSLTNFYFYRAVVKAPNAKLYNFLKYDLELTESFKNDPHLCFKHSLGMAMTVDESTKIDADKFSNLKSDVIESSYTNPTEFTPYNKEEIIKILKNEFVKNKFDEKDIEKLSVINTLSHEEGCKVAYEFEYSLNTLGEEKGMVVYKSLLYPNVKN